MSEPLVRVLGARCNSCGTEWASWGLTIRDAPVLLKIVYPFVVDAKTVRHFMVQETPNQCIAIPGPCGGRIEIATEPVEDAHG